MAKVHIHEEQFDGHWHARCGRADQAVSEDEFAATPRASRCRICERAEFPYGQPESHHRASAEAFLIAESAR